jgi:hypothetical protein
MEYRSQTTLQLDLEISFLLRLFCRVRWSAEVPQRRVIGIPRIKHVPRAALAAEAYFPDTRAGVNDNSILDTV